MSISAEPILVVAHEPALRAAVARVLVANGERVELADGVGRARQILGLLPPMLAIVAPHNLGADGLALARDLHAGSEPLIVLTETANGSVRPAPPIPCAGTCPGRPLDEARLLAQVRSLRANGNDGAPEAAMPQALSFAGFTLDVAGHSVRDASGREVKLTPAEFALLLAFARSPGRALSRDQLMTMVAGREADSYDRGIDVLVGRVRRKIEPDPQRPSLIVTLPRVGYKFTAHPKHQSLDPFPQPPPAKGGGVEHQSPLPLREGVGGRAGAAGALHPSEIRQITVLACEFVELAGPSSGLAAEDRFAQIASGRQHCGAIISKCGGQVANVLGHRMVAYFGHPQANEHDAERAVRAGLAIVESLADLATGHGAALTARIGVATGPVLVSRLADAADQAAIGEPLTVAATIAATAEAGTVAMGLHTRRLTGRLFASREYAGSWRVIADRSAAESRFEALRVAGPTRFIGREGELDRLLRGWRQARSGAGRIALISGEAGIGKSRLCAAFAERIAAEPHRTLRAQCSPHHRNTMLHPFAEHLEKATAFAGAPPSGISPAQQRRRTLSLLLDWLEALAGRQALLLFVEDVHWADAVSLELLDLVAERIRRLHVFVVVTARPGIELACAGLGNVDSLVVDRLDRAQSAAMVAEVSRGRKLPAAIVQSIAARTDGIPLFIQELTRTVLDAGADDDARGAEMPADIPETLQDSLRERLDRVGAAVAIARTAAVIGQTFSYHHVAGLAENVDTAVRAALKALVGAGLLSVQGDPPAARYSFDHALIQEAAYATLLRDERRALHGRFADLLEAEFESAGTGVPELLAHHFGAADLHEKSATYWRLAGQRAIARGDAAGAIAHVTEGLRALRLLPSTPERDRLGIEQQLVLCDLLLPHKGPAAPETRRAWAHARDLCSTSGHRDLRARALQGLFIYHWGQCEFLQAEDLAAAMLRDAAPPGNAEASMTAHRAMALTLFCTGEFAAAILHYETAYALWRAAFLKVAENPTAVDLNGVLTMSGLCFARLITGQPAAALALLDDVMRLTRAMRHPHSLVRALGTECFFRQLRREPAAVRVAAEELGDLARAIDDGYWMAVAGVFAGWARSAERQSCDGAEMIRTSLDAFQTRSAPIHGPHYLGMLADAYRYAAMPARALETITAACALAERTGEQWTLAELWRLHGDLLFQQTAPDVEAATACYERGIALARQQGARLFLLRCSARKAQLTGIGERLKASPPLGAERVG